MGIRSALAAAVMSAGIIGSTGAIIGSTGASVRAATIYWDPNGATGEGGSGTWTSQSTALFSPSTTGTATLQAAGTGDTAVFQTTAGIVTLGPTSGAGTLTVGSLTFNTTGYTLATASGSTIVLNGNITLANSVNLTLAPKNTGALTIGSVTGGTGSSLTLGGSTSSATSDVRINLVGGTIAASAPITITTSGTLGVSGIVSSSGTSTISAGITNNSGVITNLGATSGNTLNVNGVVTGSAGVIFAAGVSGGAGTVVLNASNTYTGATEFNGTSTGSVKLGVTNALPTSTALIMGFSSTNGQNLNLNGFNQTVGSLASNSGGTGVITNGAASGISTLTIGDSTATSFGLAIQDGANAKVALIRSGSGTTTLTASNSYTGGTTISGGVLYVNGSLASGNAVTISGGTLAGSGTAAGTVALNSGTISPGASFTNNVSTLATGSETWSNNGNYNWELANSTGTAGSGFDQLNVTGTLDLGGITTANGFKLNLWSLSATNADTNGDAKNFSNANAGSWIIATTTGGILNTADLGNIQINTAATNGTGGFSNSLAGGSFSLTISGNNLVLNFSPGASTNLTWNGTTGTNTWDPTSGTTDWLNGASGASYSDGNNVTFDDTAANDNVNVTSAVAPGNITFNNSGTYTFSGSNIGGGGNLVKGGSGTVIFQNSTTYSGSTTINAGKVQLGVANALPTGTAVTLANTAGATLDLHGFNQTLSELNGGGTTGGNVTLGAGTLTVGDSSNLTYGGVISGGGSFIKKGSGSMTLTNTNTFLGGLSVNNGVLVFSADGNLGDPSGSITINGGQLQTASAASLSSTRTIYLGTTGSINVQTADATGLTFNGSMQDIPGGVAGVLTKQGGGALVLGGVSTYTGATNINNGQVYLGIANALPAGTVLTIGQGTSSSNVGQLDLNGFNLQIAGLNTIGNSGNNNANLVTDQAGSATTLTISGAGSYSFGTDGNKKDIGEILGNIQLVMAGTGTQVLGSTNTFSGGLVINAGEVDVTEDANLGASSNSITINGGRLGVTASGTLASTHTISLGANIASSISTKGGSTIVTYNGVMQDLTSGGIFAKQGAGTLILGGASTYTGSTYLNNGTVQLGVANALPTGTIVNLGQAASANLGTLDLHGFNQQITGLVSTTGTNTLAATNVVTSSTPATLTINGSGNYTYGSNTAANSGVITGAVSLVVSGSGTQTLGGVNTYTGPTIITSGKLIVGVGGAGSIANSAVTVSGTGVLAGSGTVGSLTVQSGGTVKPGNSPGTATAGATTFLGGSHFEFDINDATGSSGSATAGWGLLNVSSLDISSLTSGSQLNINMFGLTAADVAGIVPDFNNSASYSWTFLHSTAPINNPGSGFNSNLFLVDTSNFSNFNPLGGGHFTVTEPDSQDLVLTYTAAPEPTSVGLLALGGLGILSRRKRRGA
jgi:autotransporter-associated beta strand protein